MIDDIDLQIRQCIHQADRILVTAHIRPDGDAIGAVLGMGLALRQIDKNVQMVLADGVPLSFRHLSGSDLIIKQATEPFDVSIFLDCSDIQRSGQSFDDRIPDINIDHHITNDGFARINLIDSNAVSTTAILAERLPGWGLHLSQAVAEALLTGLLTDTIGFRTPNVTPDTLRLAANLMERSENMSDLYEKALTRRSFQAAKYWGQGLSSIERDGRLIWASLSLEDRLASGYTGNDDADLINVLSGIEDQDVCIIFVEQKSNRVKVSWRARPGLDISRIAMHFGGGGHPAASGADITGSLTSIKSKVLEKTMDFLIANNHHHAVQSHQEKNHHHKEKP